MRVLISQAFARAASLWSSASPSTTSNSHEMLTSNLQNVLLTSLATTSLVASQSTCPDYSTYSQQHHAPFSTGRYNLSSMRPSPACRTFNSSIVEDTIASMESVIKDPDLFRLFENTFPNTLDTAVKWRGYAEGNPREELAFLITGDINAMWLRDSANQMQSYLSLLRPSSSPSSLASLYRGVINLQARYIRSAPYCNSFQPPPESGLAPTRNQQKPDRFTPAASDDVVFECKWELDSLAAFLQLSSEYFERTGDAAFFAEFGWVGAVERVLGVVRGEMGGTYAANGSVNMMPYTWERETTVGSETLANQGRGNPVRDGTGLVRSAFRPSDDATIYQLFIPANMQFSHSLGAASKIMSSLPNQQNLTNQMRALSTSIRKAIEKHGIVRDPVYGRVYAFEVDGFGSANRMDDANIPSLLSAPFFGYLNVSDPVYQNTRRYVLSRDNPYMMRGPVINAIGGPHESFGYAWPMASIIRIFTTSSEDEITSTLHEILSSTAGLGLIHESINSFDADDWTREWFSWANGLFGQCVLDLKGRAPGVLGKSFQ